MSLREVLFCVAHPRDAIRTKIRQFDVSIDAAQAPTGTTIEEFPKLPISQAAKLIDLNMKKEPPKSGIQWSEADLQRLSNGELPRGYPEHYNV
ncbi:hypothetical protein COX08_01550 [Candidatus Beckwithbacteria bacterium CG23_combo_of_CG06-09_8_20_14_all_34_8]|uniref:Uncharacterized protein n=1 Tax=Candidatus Beckwithbacteria bacterium CG23_combo_of_CG06-09_8_20_14_all_34_8 TaxID=1974497 RepID=A0A2H0B6R5_9BACT|nr:MAG: hypothetical protein COX08_01550 [Candidatus Beckwithbacteria bacterium CG23_combo_of_CG06-09_8_20_14_all_34_8]